MIVACVHCGQRNRAADDGFAFRQWCRHQTAAQLAALRGALGAALRAQHGEQFVANMITRVACDQIGQQEPRLRCGQCKRPLDGPVEP